MVASTISKALLVFTSSAFLPSAALAATEVVVVVIIVGIVKPASDVFLKKCLLFMYELLFYQLGCPQISNLLHVKCLVILLNVLFQKTWEMPYNENIL